MKMRKRAGPRKELREFLSLIHDEGLAISSNFQRSKSKKNIYGGVNISLSTITGNLKTHLCYTV